MDEATWHARHGDTPIEDDPAWDERNPCGHLARVLGCGGCDPGAVEFVKDDGGPWRRVSS